MSRDSLGMAGKYTVYQCDDGEGYYFEHEQFGDERAVRVDVDPATKQAFDYEGMSATQSTPTFRHESSSYGTKAVPSTSSATRWTSNRKPLRNFCAARATAYNSASITDEA